MQGPVGNAPPEENAIRRSEETAKQHSGHEKSESEIRNEIVNAQICEIGIGVNRKCAKNISGYVFISIQSKCNRRSTK